MPLAIFMPSTKNHGDPGSCTSKVDIYIILKIHIPKRSHSEFVSSMYIIWCHNSGFCCLNGNSYLVHTYIYENQHGLRYCCCRNSNTCFSAVISFLELPEVFFFFKIEHICVTFNLELKTFCYFFQLENSRTFTLSSLKRLSLR